MSIRHVVKPGDCLYSVALAHGHDPDTVWNDAENAALRAVRGRGGILRPGDVVLIPERRAKVESGATERRHRFERKGIPLRLKLRLMRGDEVFADEPLVLRVGSCFHEGTTDGDGWLDVAIPPDEERGTLTVRGVDRALCIGHLDPIDTESGVRGRLAKLGYPAPAEGADSLAAAVRDFQRDQELPETGELDEATRERLAAAHLC